QQGYPLPDGFPELCAGGSIDEFLAGTGPLTPLPGLPELSRLPDALAFNANPDGSRNSDRSDLTAFSDLPRHTEISPEQLREPKQHPQTLQQTKPQQLEVEPPELFSKYPSGTEMQDLPISPLAPLELGQPDKLPWASQIEELIHTQQPPILGQFHADG